MGSATLQPPRHGRIWMLAALALAASSPDALGPGLRVAAIAPRQISTNVLRNLQVGNTSLLAQRFGAGAAPGAPGQSNSMFNPASGPSVTGRRMDPGRDLLRSTPAQKRSWLLGNQWRIDLAPHGAARYARRPPDYVALQGGGRRTRTLLNQEYLLRTTAFAAPANLTGIGLGGVRDALSFGDDPEQPRYSPGSNGGAGQYDQADLMASRLGLMKERSIQEGWNWFQQGTYQRARSCFTNAEMLDRTDEESRIGVFFCLVAERKYFQMLHIAARMYRVDSGRELFETDYHILERYEPQDEDNPERRRKLAQERMMKQVKSLIAAAGSDPSPQMMAAGALALWHAGRPGEAAQWGKRMVAGDPYGAYGRLGKHILAVNADRTASSPASE